MSIFLNEYFFIPRWQFYYGELFGNENLYAIGDFEKDSSMKLFNEKVNKINYCPKVQANFKEHCELALNLQKKLLKISQKCTSTIRIFIVLFQIQLEL